MITTINTPGEHPVCPNCEQLEYLRIGQTKCHCQKCFLVFEYETAQQIQAERESLMKIRLQFVKDDPWTMNCDSYEWLIETLDRELNKPGRYLDT